jgi:hypothetical protein
MSDRSWRAAAHPSQELLFLYLEGELKKRESEQAIASHLADCWECQRNCEEFRRGIYAFMEHRREFLLPAVAPPPPPRLIALQGPDPSFLDRVRLTVTARLRKLYYFSGRSPWTAAVASVSVIALVAALVLIQTPRLTAAEILSRAVDSERKTKPGNGEYTLRRIQMSCGNRVFQRVVVGGAASEKQETPSLDSNLTALLRSTPLDWDDPLSSNTFSVWRASQPSAEDEVTDEGDHFIVTTRLTGLQDLKAASLVLRKMDWHPVREQLEFRDGLSVEIVELAYEVHTGARFAEVRRSPNSPVPGTKPTEATVLHAAPTEEQLEIREAEVRTILHSMDVGLNGEEGNVRIERSPKGLVVEIGTATRARREVLERALHSIPGVQTRILSEEESQARAFDLGVPPSAVPATETHPLLQDVLDRYFGNHTAATDQAATMRAEAGRVAVLSGQLLELAKRYPVSRLDAMPQSAHIMVDAVAADLLRRIDSDIHAQRSQLEPILHSAFATLRASAASVADAPHTTTSWPEAAPDIFMLSGIISHDSNHLFANVSTDAQHPAGAEETLESLLGAQSRLLAVLKNVAVTCPPFGNGSLTKR